MTTPTLDNIWNATIQHPETIIAALIGAISASVLSTLIVHSLTRSREREAWIRNCEKEEWRELVTALTKAEVLLVKVANSIKDKTISHEQLDEYREVANDAFRIMLDRIFITEAIAATPLIASWSDVQNNYFKGECDATFAAAEFAKIKSAIIGLATKRKKSLVQRLKFWEE